MADSMRESRLNELAISGAAISGIAESADGGQTAFGADYETDTFHHNKDYYVLDPRYGVPQK